MSVEPLGPHPLVPCADAIEAALKDVAASIRRSWSPAPRPTCCYDCMSSKAG
jgi:hypothetical protein